MKNYRRFSPVNVQPICRGRKPSHTTSALVSGGVLPELTYRAAIEQFGKHGAAELSYLVGLYCLVSVALNTFDVPIPD